MSTKLTVTGSLRDCNICYMGFSVNRRTVGF